MPVKETWPSVVWSSASVTPSSSASSASVGVRCRVAWSSATVCSRVRALARTDLGTQSMARSSSSMLPLIREIAYVSNL